MRRLACSIMTLFVVATVVLALVPTRSLASDVPGCEGLSAYQSDMEQAVGPLYSEYIEKIDSMPEDPMAFTSDDWLTFAEIVLDYNRAVRTVDPPAWAQDWHDALIAYTGTLEQMLKAIATGGLFVALAYDEAITDAEGNLKQEERAIREQCDDFGSFAEQWGFGSSLNDDATATAEAGGSTIGGAPIPTSTSTAPPQTHATASPSPRRATVRASN